MLDGGGYTRREIGSLALATLVGLCIGDFPAPAQTGIKKYVVPAKPRAVHIDQTVKALSSGTPAGNGSYVPNFIDVVNHVHFNRYRKSYQDYMRDYSSQNPYIKIPFPSNDLEVIIEDGSIVRRLAGNANVAGKFVHADSPQKSNQAYLDSSLSPSRFLMILFHELSHSFIGGSEVLAHIHTHREMADAVALYPQLLMEKDEQCPLTQLMLYYRGSVQNNERSSTFSMQPEHLAYLTLLHSNINTGMVIDTSNAFDFLLKQGQPMYQQILSKAMPLFRLNPNFAPDIIKDFAAKTEQYILKQNPNMPANKRALLRRKMNRIASLS